MVTLTKMMVKRCIIFIGIPMKNQSQLWQMETKQDGLNQFENIEIRVDQKLNVGCF